MSKLINFRADDGLGALPDETPILYKAARSFLNFATAETVIPMPRVLGPTVLLADVSKWQGEIDFQKMKANGIKGVWIKASQGLWVDSRYEVNIKGAADAGLRHGLYSYLDPAQTSVTPERAAEYFNDLSSGIGDLSLWPDAEAYGLTFDYVWRFTRRLKELQPNRKIEEYTRLSWWNTYIARSNYWRSNGIGLNAARYNLALSSPWSDKRYLPLDWDYDLLEFLLWQYSADGNGMGAFFGCESGSIDLNLFYGDQAAFDKRYPVEAEHPPSDLQEQIDEIKQELIEIETSLVLHDGEIESLKDRITKLENEEPAPVEPPAPADYLTVRVYPDNNCPVYLPVGHDAACPGEDPPGKPTPENKIGIFEKNATFKIYRSGYYCCKDDPNTPEIKTGYGDHYLVYGGDFDMAMVPAKRVTIVS